MYLLRPDATSCTCLLDAYLRIPTWCRGARVQVNGQAVTVDSRHGQYIRLERAWMSGDVVTIDLAMALSMTIWPRNGAVTVDGGPLSYSIRIGERWQRCICSATKLHGHKYVEADRQLNALPPQHHGAAPPDCAAEWNEVGQRLLNWYCPSA